MTTKPGDHVVSVDGAHPAPGVVTTLHPRGHVYVRWANGLERKHYEYELASPSSLPVAIARTMLGAASAQDKIAFSPRVVIRGAFVLLALAAAAVACAYYLGAGS